MSDDAIGDREGCRLGGIGSIHQVVRQQPMCRLARFNPDAGELDHFRLLFSSNGDDRREFLPLVAHGQLRPGASEAALREYRRIATNPGLAPTR